MNPAPIWDLKLETAVVHPHKLKNISVSSVDLTDRIDIHIEVSDQNPKLLRQSASKPLSSKQMKEQVDQAISKQKACFSGTDLKRNSDLKGSNIDQYCELENEAENLLLKGMEKLGLSSRAYYKVLLIARTIADLEGSQLIQIDHVSEALNYRVLDQKLFR